MLLGRSSESVGYQVAVVRRSVRAPGIRRPDGRALIALILLAVLFGLYAYIQWNAKPHAPVIGTAWVADGDSIEIAGTRLRLEGIDAPELDQACADDKGQSWSCGRTAARELRSHIGAHKLDCRHKGVDRFERVLAVCLLPDGSDVNAWMVRQGWALASSRAGTYQTEEDAAKAARRGIWAGTFVPPREWRRLHPRND